MQSELRHQILGFDWQQIDGGPHGNPGFAESNANLDVAAKCRLDLSQIHRCDVADLARTGYVTEVPINPFSITFMVPSPGDPDHGVGIQGIGKGLWGLVGF